MLNNIDLIRSIAESVRFWAEGRAEGSYMEGDLNGMCAIATAELFRQLAKEGIKSEICVWVCHDDGESAHVYLLVEDHVVDVTATQFTKMRNIPVYIEHVKEAERWDWYNAELTFDNVESLIKYQKKVRWAADQVAWSK